MGQRRTRRAGTPLRASGSRSEVEEPCALRRYADPRGAPGRPLSPEPPWEREWIRWRDFWLPADPDAASGVLRNAHWRAHADRVEVACSGGVGRTGTALAAMCVFEGMEPDAAVEWVRERYHPRAVEVPRQRLYLERIPRCD